METLGCSAQVNITDRRQGQTSSLETGAEGRRSRGSGELRRDPQRAVSGQHLGAVWEGQGCVAWYWETKQVGGLFLPNKWPVSFSGARAPRRGGHGSEGSIQAKGE